VTTRAQRDRLIADADVDSKFDTAAIARLAQTAKLSPDADLGRFGNSVRAAVWSYLDEARRPHPGEIREEIERLHDWALKALKRNASPKESATALEAIRRALTNLSPEAGEHLHTPHRPLPGPADFDDPEKCPQALRHLLGLTVRGAEWKPGRKRPGGKQSRPVLTRIPGGPRPPRGRPKNSAEVMLCFALEVAYRKVTGRRAPRSAHDDLRGPFVNLLGEVLELCGLDDVSPVEVVNSAGESRGH